MCYVHTAPRPIRKIVLKVTIELAMKRFRKHDAIEPVIFDSFSIQILFMQLSLTHALAQVLAVALTARQPVNDE
jgi:hypothetical protein